MRFFTHRRIPFWQILSCAEGNLGSVSSLNHELDYRTAGSERAVGHLFYYSYRTNVRQV